MICRIHSLFINNKAVKQQNETLEKANSQNETIANECESLRIELQNNNKDYQQLRNEYNIAKAQIDELKQANAVLEQTIDAISIQEQSMAQLASELIQQAEETPEQETTPEPTLEPAPEPESESERPDAQRRQSVFGEGLHRGFYRKRQCDSGTQLELESG